MRAIRRPLQLAATVAVTSIGLVAEASPAGACGGLVGENGSIQLTKTTTLAAFHNGIERYVTSFQFTGEGAELGSIIPLPDVPTDVVRGGDEVGRWARDNGFLLTPDAPEMLDFYASRSQVFMAARFDASRAAALGQNAGDGTPIMLTIPTDAPWVPLRILSLGLEGAGSSRPTSSSSPTTSPASSPAVPA